MIKDWHFGSWWGIYTALQTPTASFPFRLCIILVLQTEYSALHGSAPSTWFQLRRTLRLVFNCATFWCHWKGLQIQVNIHTQDLLFLSWVFIMMICLIEDLLLSKEKDRGREINHHLIMVGLWVLKLNWHPISNYKLEIRYTGLA